MKRPACVGLLLFCLLLPSLAEVAVSVQRTSGTAASTSYAIPSGFTAAGSATDAATALPVRIRHNATGYELVLITGGDLYYIGADEVRDDAANPMVEVTWSDASEWAARQGMRLPTEAEWDRAARGNFGLQNASGGVWEWMNDLHENGNGAHVIRSGQGATGLTVRAYGQPDYKDNETGIRAAVSPIVVSTPGSRGGTQVSVNINPGTRERNTSAPSTAPSRSRLPALAGYTAVGTEADPATGQPLRIRHNASGYELAFVPAGSFVMGSPEGRGNPNEAPAHRVEVGAFWIGVKEVTNTQFTKTWGNHNSGPGRNGANQPVVQVNWDEARLWCEQQGMHLPTEAEWEKAVWGNYGLSNMIDGVWEWCWDWHDANYYSFSGVVNPAGPESSPDGGRVIRGGEGASGATMRAHGPLDYKDEATSFRAVVRCGQ